MDQILDRLWLGDFADAEQACAPIDYLLTLCEACPPSTLRVAHFSIPDEVYLPVEWSDLVKHLSMFLQRSTVLVHCRLGKSRSPALVAAYLASIGWHDPETALAYVKSKRAIVEVHSETWRGVTAWWEG